MLIIDWFVNDKLALKQKKVNHDKHPYNYFMY